MPTPKETVPIAKARGLLAVLKKAGLTARDISLETSMPQAFISRILNIEHDKRPYTRIAKDKYDQLLALFIKLNKADPQFHQKVMTMAQESGALQQAATETADTSNIKPQTETASATDVKPPVMPAEAATDVGIQSTNLQVDDFEANLLLELFNRWIEDFKRRLCQALKPQSSKEDHHEM